MTKAKTLPPDMEAAHQQGLRLRAERKERVDAYTREVTERYLQEHGSLTPLDDPFPRSTRHTHSEACLRPVDRNDSTGIFVRRYISGREQYVYETGTARLVDGRWVLPSQTGVDTVQWCSVMHTGIAR